jgi:hypothetical protein
VLEDKYRITHKLGHCEKSAVWLAHDIKEQKDVALKIMIARNEGENEYSMQKEIKNAMQGTSNLLSYI